MTSFESLSTMGAWMNDGSDIMAKWSHVRDAASDPSTPSDHLRVLAVVQPARVLANPSTDVDTLLAIVREYPAVMNDILAHPALSDGRERLVARISEGKTLQDSAALLAFGVALAEGADVELLDLVRGHERYRWLFAHRPPGAQNAARTGTPDDWVDRWLTKVERDPELDAPVAEVVLSSPFFDPNQTRKAFDVLTRACPEPFDIHPRVSALLRHHPDDTLRATLSELSGLSVHMPA